MRVRICGAKAEFPFDPCLSTLARRIAQEYVRRHTVNLESASQKQHRAAVLRVDRNVRFIVPSDLDAHTLKRNIYDALKQSRTFTTSDMLLI